ncbi:hypothetical protein WA026_000317 [Henosepilachna vigintioctopunctata]|uniref:Major facilitator superfamily (MFS) profile domain-containing protein n=1 Tax=Henosepilachna vigintioctopunctata TaxID=420089 RepID=A0AAW1V5N9_9CUCU
MPLRKPPYRTWVALMVMFTTAVNYNFRTFFPVALIAIVDKPKSQTLDNGTVISVPQPDYGPRYSWKPHEEGQLIGSYFYGYTFGSLIGGPTTEFFGPYWTMLTSTFICAAITSLSVLVVMESWIPLFVTRVLVGLVGGVQYPALQCLIGRWAPPNEKGKFVACLMGNVLGTVITQSITGVIVSNFGWNWGFFSTAFITVVYLTLWAIIVADSPEKSWLCSKEEVEYISECHQGSVKATRSKKPPIRQMATSIPFLVLIVFQFGNLWGLYMLLTVVPKFMSDVLEFNLKSVGFLSSCPSLARLVFGFVFGGIADFLLQREILPKVVVRKGFAVISHVLPGVTLFMFLVIGKTVWLAVLLLVLVMVFNGAAVVTCLVNAQDLAPNFAGTQYGIMSFIGSMSGFIVPAIAAEATREKNDLAHWAIVFCISGALYAGCGIVFILFGSVTIQPWNEKADTESAPTTANT